MQREEKIQMARRAIEAFNNGDWATFREGITPDAVYQEAGTGRRIEGADAYMQVLEAWRRALPDVHGEIIDVVVDGDTLVERIVWTGTHGGPLETPGMTIPPTGRSFRVESINWIRFDGDRTSFVHHQLDVMGLMQQLGLVGQPEKQTA